MLLQQYQEWVRTFYQSRNWHQYNIFIRLNFLTEEVGELSQAIRRLEIGRDRPDENEKQHAENLIAISEEIGDILDNLVIIADKYQLSFDEIIKSHQEKLSNRYCTKGD